MPLSYDATIYAPTKLIQEGGENVHVALRSLENPDQAKTSSQYNSDNGVGGGFDGVSSSTFTISSDKVHIIEDFILQINCRNTSGNLTITPNVVPFLINRIEVMVNGSIFENIYPYELYSETLMNEPQEYVVAQQTTLNMSPTTYNAANAIAASTNQTYYLPLRCFVNNTLFMCQLINQVQIRVYWASTPVSSGSGTLSLVSSFLWAMGKSFAARIRDRLIQKFNARKHVTRTVTRRDNSIAFGTLTNAVSSEQPLSGLTGSFCSIKMMLVAASAVPASDALYTYEPLSYITIKDSSGIPLNSIQNIPAELVQYVWPKVTGGYPGQGQQVKYIYEYPLGDAPCESENEGDASGFSYFNGKFNLMITPGTLSTSPGSYTMRVCGYQYTLVSQNVDGSVDVAFV